MAFDLKQFITEEIASETPISAEDAEFVLKAVRGTKMLREMEINDRKATLELLKKLVSAVEFLGESNLALAGKITETSKEQTKLLKALDKAFPEVQSVRVENPVTQFPKPDWLPDFQAMFDAQTAALTQTVANLPAPVVEATIPETATTVRSIHKKSRLEVMPLTGTLNGSNTEFYLPFAPRRDQFFLIVNGAVQKQGTGEAYTLTGNKVTYAIAPKASWKHFGIAMK